MVLPSLYLLSGLQWLQLAGVNSAGLASIQSRQQVTGSGSGLEENYQSDAVLTTSSKNLN